MKGKLSSSILLPILLIVLPGCSSSFQSGDSARVFYVSVDGNDNNKGTLSKPFKTIEKAQEKVRKVNGDMKSDVIVYLRQGTYTLTKPLEFGAKDSGTNGHSVIYKAYQNEKVTISGGKPVTGWSLHDPAANIYKAHVGDLKSRQLFVNGKRAKRASSDSGLPDVAKLSDGFSTSAVKLAEWKNIKNMELVFLDVWTNSRGLIESIETVDGKAKIKMQQPGWSHLTNKGLPQLGLPWYLENAYELINEDGEWYLDQSSGDLYYKPLANENMTKADTIVPVVETLVSLKGTSADEIVHHIGFDGLTFAYTTWYQPSLIGHSDAQANVTKEKVEGLKYHKEMLIEASFEAQMVQNIIIEDCRFEKLGGAGLNLTEGSQNVRIKGNVFTDISGSGIQVGEPDRNNRDNYNPEDPRKIIKNIEVSNNYIRSIGIDYRSSIGIYGTYTQNMVIRNNELIDLPYSAISLGWGWGSLDPTYSKENKIENNYIHDVMKKLYDGGSIYTQGAQPDSTIKGNYIDKQVHKGGSIYPDEGSAYFTISDNVIMNVPSWLQIWAKSTHDNKVTNNYSNSKNLTNTGTNNILDKNQFIASVEENENAMKIKNQAGLEFTYQHLRMK
ncbi:right-handed parallel beta-helix repeat-containing protein [Paenibacillus sedimenti]|uniref:Right-handed parallel beta-helix repeat-containing protein n=1 Tax=Paenibacillus sedimenti TaxID=2770274 RepID=A0A926KMM5_9BACL|nr:right-handed parallel beta-helix repeat-containing protein [Paenibacillus sedimenti]MBD0379786.1 right-handed parallel beta-helix repeat-containing protein [Paenibacillus sedimenti]